MGLYGYRRLQDAALFTKIIWFGRPLLNIHFDNILFIYDHV